MGLDPSVADMLCRMRGYWGKTMRFTAVGCICDIV